MKEFIEKNKEGLMKLIVVIGVLLALFLLAVTCEAVKSYQYIGDDTPATDTITVNGQGTVNKAPDTAKFSFTIQDEEKDTASAQSVVSKKIDQVKSDLLAAGVASADINTADYNSYPDYVPSSVIIPAGEANTGSQLKGYIVSQNVTVNVKDLSKTETVAGILGKDGVTSIDGPNLGFENPNEVSDEARAAAIADAKTQAETLAKQLDVRLVRIVSFSENGGSPTPIMYDKAMGAAVPSIATPPSIPTGDQTVTSNVSITYEIR